MITLPVLLMVLGALVLGAMVGWLAAAARQTATREALAAESARAAALQARTAELDARLTAAMQTSAQLQAQLSAAAATHTANTEKLAWTAQTDQRLREAFEALAAKALHANSEAFVRQTRDQLDASLKQMQGDWSVHKEQISHLVQPVEKTLKILDDQVRQMEQKREGAYRALEQHLGDLRSAHQELSQATVQLRSTLTTNSRARGQWGELQLRRIVEMAGMLRHVDFDEQAQAGEQRPDMIIRLPNGGILPVDAKSPLEQFLQAAEAPDDEARRARMKSHTAAMRNHVQTLSRKEYWKQFEKAPEVVVMFVPSEASLSAAFEADPTLIEDGLLQHVLLATPVTLFGLLKAVAFGWQQQASADNAREIALAGHELCDRLNTFLQHLQKTGRGLDTAVKAYNEAVGSAEGRLLPSAERIRALGALQQKIEPLEPVERQVRALVEADPTVPVAVA